MIKRSNELKLAENKPTMVLWVLNWSDKTTNLITLIKSLFPKEDAEILLIDIDSNTKLALDHSIRIVPCIEVYNTESNVCISGHSIHTKEQMKTLLGDYYEQFFR